MATINLAARQTGDLQGLLQDERFLRKSFDEKVQLLKRTGMDDGEAQQRALEVQQRQPQGPSAMDAPPDETFATKAVRTVGQVGLRAAPSIVGEVAGETIAPFVGVPPQIGGAIGAATGEAGSQLVGLNPFSVEQILLAGGTAAMQPPAAQLTRKALSIPATQGKLNLAFEKRLAVVRKVPGSAGAIQEIARAQVEKIPNQIRARTDALLAASRPGETVTSLFEAALASGTPLVPLRSTFRMTEKVRTIQKKAGAGGLGDSRLRKVSKGMSDLSRQTAGVPLDVLDAQRREVEGLLGATVNKAHKRQYRMILAGMFQDIDNAAAAGVNGATDLLDALKFSRRNLAADDIQALLDRPGVLSRPQLGTGAQEIKVNTLLDGVRRARTATRPPPELRLLKDSIPDDELLDIERTLETWNQALSALPPPRGVQFGSGMNIAASGGVGLVVKSLTGSTEAAMGAAGAVVSAKFLLSRILMSPAGRRILRETIEQGQPLDLVQLATTTIMQSSRQALGANPGQRLLDAAQGQEEIATPR